MRALLILVLLGAVGCSERQTILQCTTTYGLMQFNMLLVLDEKAGRITIWDRRHGKPLMECGAKPGPCVARFSEDEIELNYPGSAAGHSGEGSILFDRYTSRTLVTQRPGNGSEVAEARDLLGLPQQLSGPGHCTRADPDVLAAEKRYF